MVVPQKMFVMYCEAAAYPVNVLSLAEAKPVHDTAARTVSLQVCMLTRVCRCGSAVCGACRQIAPALQVGGRKFTFRGSTEQDAQEWQHALSSSAKQWWTPTDNKVLTS